MEEENVDTYNVYDDFGRLSCVIPPESVKSMSESGDWNHMNKTNYAKWNYYYEYDHRGRLRAKEIPGAGRTKYIYDKRDQLILTQDAVQTGKNEYSFTKYDILGRPVQTGIYTTAGIPLIGIAQSRYEQHSEQSLTGYTNNAFPISGHTVLTYSYYDDYDTDNNGTPDYDYHSTQGGLGLPQNYMTRLNGQLTYTKVRYGTDSDPNWLNTVNFYDDRMRVIQTRADNHLDGYDITSTEYDFAGKALRTFRYHKTSTETIGIRNKFRYDHAGRLVKVFQKTGSDPEITLSEQNYNELGQVMEKNLYNSNSSLQFSTRTTYNPYLQSIDYRYNIRGWLEMINEVDVPSQRLSNTYQKARLYSKVKASKLTVELEALTGDELESERGFKINEESQVEKNLDIPTAETLTKTSTVKGMSSSDSPMMTDKTFEVDMESINITDETDIEAALIQLESLTNEKLDEQGVTDARKRKMIQSELKRIAVKTWSGTMRETDVDANDLFSQRLYYDNNNNNLNANAQYNGNISSTVWRVKGKQRQAYGFKYDDLDRLTSARYRDINDNNSYTLGNTFGVPNIKYDLNGNIMELKRNGIHEGQNGATIDDLSYDYGENGGNQLLGVQDATGISLGFSELPTNFSVDYLYDSNGNMTKDLNKGIEIEYNKQN
ncbi:MAG: hypothetical protein ACPG5P_02805, partial [Saprospiraceae bacterium]